MSNHTIDLIGAHGTHAQDLIARGIFEDMSVREIDQDTPLPADAPDATVLAVPIWEAKEVVRRIMEERWPDHLIIDCSGVMRSANTWTLLPYSQISQFHFLAGPGIGENLRVAAVSGKVRNAVFQRMLLNAEENNIRVVETSTDVHDSTMGFVQWLVHACALLLREMGRLPDDMLTRHTKTPTRTSVEMILLNFRTSPVIREFTSMWDTFQSAFEATMALVEESLGSYGKKLDDFSTPFFRFFAAHVMKWEFNDISWEEFSEKLKDLPRWRAEELSERIEKAKED